MRSGRRGTWRRSGARRLFDLRLRRRRSRRRLLRLLCAHGSRKKECETSQGQPRGKTGSTRSNTRRHGLLPIAPRTWAGARRKALAEARQAPPARAKRFRCVIVSDRSLVRDGITQGRSAGPDRATDEPSVQNGCSRCLQPFCAQQSDTEQKSNDGRRQVRAREVRQAA